MHILREMFASCTLSSWPSLQWSRRPWQLYLASMAQTMHTTTATHICMLTLSKLAIRNRATSPIDVLSKNWKGHGLYMCSWSDMEYNLNKNIKFVRASGDSYACLWICMAALKFAQTRRRSPDTDGKRVAATLLLTLIHGRVQKQRLISYNMHTLRTYGFS